MKSYRGRVDVCGISYDGFIIGRLTDVDRPRDLSGATAVGGAARSGTTDASERVEALRGFVVCLDTKTARPEPAFHIARRRQPVVVDQSSSTSARPGERENAGRPSCTAGKLTQLGTSYMTGITAMSELLDTAPVEKAKLVGGSALVREATWFTKRQKSTPGVSDIQLAFADLFFAVCRLLVDDSDPRLISRVGGGT